MEKKNWDTSASSEIGVMFFLLRVQGIAEILVICLLVALIIITIQIPLVLNPMTNVVCVAAVANATVVQAVVNRGLLLMEVW
ncbi:MAG: hypothetical protein IJ789_05215 [Bacteroidales bacterium]|nr:hypothetical protein [Bacteroidales bacterium]